MHPALTQELVNVRVDELRRHPVVRSGRDDLGTHRVRRSTGWFLVNVGLRLAIPGAPVSPAAR